MKRRKTMYTMPQIEQKQEKKWAMKDHTGRQSGAENLQTAQLMRAIPGSDEPTTARHRRATRHGNRPAMGRVKHRRRHRLHRCRYSGSNAKKRKLEILPGTVKHAMIGHATSYFGHYICTLPLGSRQSSILFSLSLSQSGKGPTRGS